jgi:hypothetical protein
MTPNASIAPWFIWDCARQDVKISTLYEKAQGLSVGLAEAHIAESHK